MYHTSAQQSSAVSVFQGMQAVVQLLAVPCSYTMHRDIQQGCLLHKRALQRYISTPARMDSTYKVRRAGLRKGI